MNNEKQTQARNLFFQSDLSRTEIAQVLGIPRRTLHYWIRQNNWDRQKECADIMPSFLAENCYKVIDRFTQQLLAAETITHKDAEALHKFTITVNKLKNRATLNENMEIFGHFMDSVNQKSPEMAQIISPYIEEYIGAQSQNNTNKFKPVKKTTSPEEIARELELDQEDLKAWAEETDPIVSEEQILMRHHDENTMEQYIEHFKQIDPNISPEDIQRFRQVYREKYIDRKPTATPKAA